MFMGKMICSLEFKKNPLGLGWGYRWSKIGCEFIIALVGGWVWGSLHCSLYFGLCWQIFTKKRRSRVTPSQKPSHFPQRASSLLRACQAACHAEPQSSGLLLPLEGRVVALRPSISPGQGFRHKWADDSWSGFICGQAAQSPTST